MTRPETGFSDRKLAELFDNNIVPFTDNNQSEGAKTMLTAQCMWSIVLVLALINVSV